MKIKRLEILGFKSFVDKMTFDFPQGITAVVGPNGCGKSNIVDAIRWVMGEQSAKNLRGKSMEDLIFGGSESRKPLGMAEVTLTFSAEDGRVPAKYLSYSEIQVTRRLYRDGESEYLLNKTPCRLMDISELFMDTGVGARAYSIIEQGRIGMILLSKPEERRFLIEEAAGVTKFKSRKQVALKKIEHSRQNLLRIGDIIAELKRQLNSLQRQAKKAERFRAFREEQKEIEVTLAAGNYATLDDERTNLAAELADLEAKAAAVAGDVESRDLALEEKRIALLELEKNLSVAQEETYRLKGEIQGHENRLEFRKKESLNLENQRQRLAEELVNITRQLAESGGELALLEDRKGAFDVELAAAEESLRAGEHDLEEQTAAERELALRLDRTRRELFGILSEIAQLNNQQSGAVKRLEAIEERFDRNRRERLALQDALAGAEKRAADLLTEVGAQAELKGEVVESLAACSSRVESLKVSLDLLDRELLTRRDELSKKKSRLHSLQELEAQFAGYGRGVRSIFLAESFKGRFPGVVADMLEVEEAYELALEAALGEKLQYVACGGEDEAVAAVSYLKQTSGGRCCLVPKDLLPSSTEQPPAGLTRLLDKATIRDGWREAVGLLLAEFYLADDLPAALSLARRYPRLAFVTPGGEVAGWGGIVNGGSTEAAQQGLVHKKREIKDLVRAVSLTETALQGKERERERLKADLARAEEEVRGARQRMHEAELRLVTTGNDLQRAREECRGVEERIVLKGLEDDQFREERDALQHELEHAREKKVAGEARKGEAEAAVAGLERELAARKEGIDRDREAVTELKVGTAALREKRESNFRAIRRVEELAGDLRMRRNGHDADLEKCIESHRQLVLAIAGDEEMLGRLLARQLEADTAHAAVRERFDAEALALQEDEAGIRGIRSCCEEVRQTLAVKSLRNSELAMTLKSLENSLMDKYRLDITQFLPKGEGEGKDLAAMQERRTELQALIDEMGDVNLMAIEEYRELEERFAFLSEQKADLEESLQSLQKAIQRINKTTRKRFLETFHLVNAKFQEVFPRLFCGGRAELKLTNEEDLLETGIDIVVQPPGKKLQNVTLLSGGEKALTAVALIFSIFLIKPSPFCLLDEVDAPLDDANIGRFNEMIRDMTAFSQFIVITHNKATMTVADTLFGVTMEEPGVSKLVSVRLN